MVDVFATNIIGEHYNNIAVLYELVKYCYGREFVILGDLKVRGMMINQLAYLKRHMKRYNFTIGKNNLYMSVAKVYGLRCYSYDPKVRSQQLKELSVQWDNMITGYDFVFDFDGKGTSTDGDECLMNAYNDCKILKSLLDSYGIPYIVKCSGSGFHIRIEDEHINTVQPFCGVHPRIEFCRKVVNLLKDLYALETLDVSIYDSRRIWKVPYSLDYKTGNVAMPFTDKEFEQFVPGNVCPVNEKFISIIKRKENIMRKYDPALGGIKKFVNELV